MNHGENQDGGTQARIKTLVFGAIGVVYGDIGTSPLYTLKQTFGVHGAAATEPNVLGVLSLVFWSLILVVSIKYAGFIMRADNKGEGGIMALTALAQRSVRSSQRGRLWIVMLGLFGAALFYADGIITPAVSVLGSMEGMKEIPGVGPRLAPLVLPATAGILIALSLAVHARGCRGGAVLLAVAALLPSASCAAAADASSGSAPTPPAAPRKVRRSIGLVIGFLPETGSPACRQTGLSPFKPRAASELERDAGAELPPGEARVIGSWRTES